jgi:hypothetical protein
MAGKDHIVAIDEDGIGEAELADAVSDLAYLLPGMCPRIARIGR